MPLACPRLVFITTVSETASSFLREQIRFFTAKGFEVHTISSPPSGESPEPLVEGSAHYLPMQRGMSPLHDLIAVARLSKLLKQLRPNIVQTHTPKAGFLGMMAAFAARVPVRIYTVNGLAILTQPLWGRVILWISERLACGLATQVLCVSRSVRRFIVAARLCPKDACRTLGDGGSHGVDTVRFDPQLHAPLERTRLRALCGIPEDALVLGFVGRIIPEKGIAELAAAWKLLRQEFPYLHLLVCGYRERVHPLASAVFEELKSDSRVHFTSGRVTDMPAIYSAVDITVLPTYREGLTNVALESAAMQVPIVATRVPGCVDAVRNQVTGLLVQPRDSSALTAALRRLILDPGLRRRMGVAARQLVLRRFSETRISELLLQDYYALLRAGGHAHLTPYGETVALSH